MSDRKHSVTLPRAGGTEQQFVFVCVNGRAYQVPRGKSVEVPQEVFEALENARILREQAQRAEQQLAVC